MSFNKQETFNTIYRGLYAQDFVQAKEGGVCRFRTYDDKKCAIGMLIPDDKYDAATMEDHGGIMRNVAVQKAIGIYSEDRTNTDERLFLSDIQIIHDRNSVPAFMIEDLQAFAHKNGLTIPDCE